MQSIAIVAPMHSGKTTLANLLVERGYVKIAMADPLKECAIAMLNVFLQDYDIRNLIPDRWDGLEGRKTIIPIDRQELEDSKAVFRPFLQWLGTEFRHYLKNEDLWIDLFRTVAAGDTKPIVVDDVRFSREAAALRDLGFRIIRLTRPEEDRLASLRSMGLHDDTALRHASETELESIDVDYTYHTNHLGGLRDIADRIAAGDDRIAAA